MGKKKWKGDTSEAGVESSKESVFEQALAFARKSGRFLRAGSDGVEHWPTGIVGIDWLLGGGVPRGRVMEISGFEGSGKSTLAAECGKVFQEREQCVVYLDFEHAVDLNYFNSIGLDINSDNLFLYDQPFCMESGIEDAIQMVNTGRVGLVIIDSVAAMVPRAELEGTMDDTQVALQARLMGKTLRKLVGPLERHKATALFINQLREKIGYEAKFNPTVTPGGRALKFYSSVRLELKLLQKNEKTNSSSHRAILKKQKTFALLRGAVEFDISPTGIDRFDHFKQCIVNVGVVENRSGSYFMGKEKIGRGQEEFDRFLESEANRAILREKLMKVWGTNGDTV